jgi:hypothetical protein
MESPLSQFCRISFALALATLLAACSAATPTSSATNSFDNFLVVGIAHDYDGRARFERTLVTELKKQGKTATAYYIAAGGNKPIDRETIESLVKSDGFDAVLITRVVNRNAETISKSASSTTTAVRKSSAFFRYDYEELNEPATLNVTLAIDISSELFDPSNGDLVWQLETNLSHNEMVSKVVDEAVSKISRRLKRDGFIG